MADGTTDAPDGTTATTSRVASIDIGTNSTRLLVAEAGPGASADGAPLLTVERLMRITRLGQGVDRTGALAPEAVERTVGALAAYRTVMDDLGVAPGRVRMTATSASRDASNRDVFFDAAEAAVGVRPELLSGDDEAELSFLGATSDLDPALGPFLVFDLGGGSTEFVLGTTGPDGEITGAVSLDVGCVRLAERFLTTDPPAPEDLTAAISYTDSWLDDVVRELPGASSARTVVGLAGTVSTVAAVEQGLATYDRDRLHHFTLTHAAAEDVFRTLATESRADRIHNPGLEEARADVIVGGCCALVAIYRRLALEEILTSEADILDGLALSLLR
ncbi:MAG TPA: Ppx/GppA phosphatase family protein [Aquihabitans sp.]|jgi:exopolyphosphatase/guanosine-5'-triphosphate,3'-diphosphate pyrophosphatase|nr:Ppx/GppA phosphatase family protein [Aquihabitans sp.]